VIFVVGWILASIPVSFFIDRLFRNSDESSTRPPQPMR
jgi:hypothetical protein